MRVYKKKCGLKKGRITIAAVFLLSAGMLLSFSGCSPSDGSADEANRFSDEAKGYSVVLPAGTTYDHSLAQCYTKCVSPDQELFISREWSPYPDTATTLISIWKIILYRQPIRKKTILP